MQKSLEHDEMQILLQIAIIISEWTQWPKSWREANKQSEKQQQTEKEKPYVHTEETKKKNGRIIVFPVTDRDRTWFKMTVIILMLIIYVLMRIRCTQTKWDPFANLYNELRSTIPKNIITVLFVFLILLLFLLLSILIFSSNWIMFHFSSEIRMFYLTTVIFFFFLKFFS